MAGEVDILGSAAAGAAAGSVVPGWGTAIGAGIGLATGLARYFSGQSQANAMREQEEEKLRRQRLQNAQVLGQAQAAGAASGVEYDSSSLQAYLTSMKSEMDRQLEFQRRAAKTNAGNVSTAAGIGLFTDLGQTFNQVAAMNNYWKTPA